MWEQAALFVLGGAGYLGVEVAWRGSTHWTMFFAGGLALCLLQWLARRSLPLGAAAGLGAGGVSGMELALGLACRAAGVEVWSYRAEWGNLAGLVCPKYTLYWFFLCGWVLLLLRASARFCAWERARSKKEAESPIYCAAKCRGGVRTR